jgi:hypothetical protein
MVKFIRASVLVLLLACATQAGEMQHGSPQPPPPEPTPLVVEEETMEEDNVPSDLTDILTEAALSVLNNALALL